MRFLTRIRIAIFFFNIFYIYSLFSSSFINDFYDFYDFLFNVKFFGSEAA